MKQFSTTHFLEALFNHGEKTCFSESGRGVKIDPVFQYCGSAQFFSVNPLHTTRLDANVMAFRTFLLECDKMPQDEQMAYILGLGMPWTTCVDSGGKSLHFSICLNRDLPNEAAYRLLAARLHRAVEKADHTTKNPSRFSRLGGALRDNGKEQRILGIRGRVSLESLENWLGNFPSAVPEPICGPVAEGAGQLSAQTLAFIFERSAPEGRNRALFMASCEFYRAGYSIERAEGYLRQAFDFTGADSDFTEKEFVDTVLSGYRRAAFDANHKLLIGG